MDDFRWCISVVDEDYENTRILFFLFLQTVHVCISPADGSFVRIFIRETKE